MQYRAFLSYSRADDRAANALHRALDGYRTPRALAGQAGAFGPIPERLHPIFRDRTDMSGGGALSERIEAALHESEALVVLCSPASARSVWVNQEVETFIALGRAARIFPVILEGEPECGDEARECFPPALRGRGLLAADLRDIEAPGGRRIGDGREMGRLKLIAGLLGAPLDRLIQRERRRQRALVAALGAASLVFAGVAAAAVWQTFAARRNLAEAERAAAIGLAQQSAQAILDGNLTRAFAIAADSARDYPAHADRFLTQLRWIAFATRGAVSVHQRAQQLIAAAVSPDERYIASIDDDATLAVTDLESGRTWTAPPIEEGLRFTAVAVGDEVVAVGASDRDAMGWSTRGAVQIRRLSDGALLAQFPAGGVEDTNNDGVMEPIGVYGLAVSPDGRRVAVCDGGGVGMYDAHGDLLWRSAYLGFAPARVVSGACAFDEDGAWLGAVVDGAWYFLYDAASGAVLMRRDASAFEDEPAEDDVVGPYYSELDEVRFLAGLPQATFDECDDEEGDALLRFYRSATGDSYDAVSTAGRLHVSIDDHVSYRPLASQSCRRARDDLDDADMDGDGSSETVARIVMARGAAFTADIVSPTQLVVRNAATGAQTSIRTRGDIGFGALSSDGALLFVSTSQGSELWDPRYGLMVARIDMICDELDCNHIGPFVSDTAILTRYSVQDWGHYQHEAPEFAQDVDALIQTLCPRLFGHVLSGESPRACPAPGAVTRLEN